MIRDHLNRLEKLTAAALRYTQDPLSETWYLLAASEPVRCEACSQNVQHRKVIHLRRHPDTNCEHTRSYSGRQEITVGLQAFFDANDQLVRDRKILSPTMTF